MPLPLIPIVAALAAGGTLVPHAAGGLIVTSIGGYVAGTYLSTTAIASIIVGVTATAGASIAAVTGAASALIGGAGIFGTTVGATGITGLLMSVGILPSIPIAVPIAIGGATIGSSYLAYYLMRLRYKVTSAKEGKEVHFSEKEAKVIEALIRLLGKRKPTE